MEASMVREQLLKFFRISFLRIGWISWNKFCFVIYDKTFSFSGGDQGLLNLFFKDWATKDIAKHLSFVYNVVSQAFYSYLPALKQ